MTKTIMHILYSILKTIFFALTILVGTFYLRGRQLLENESYFFRFDILMPGYLLFCGIMLGYLIAHIRSNNTTDLSSTSIAIRSFIIGIVLGLVLSFSYMYL